MKKVKPIPWHKSPPKDFLCWYCKREAVNIVTIWPYNPVACEDCSQLSEEELRVKLFKGRD